MVPRSAYAAARLWAEALEADPKLADDRQAQYRSSAACASALGATGQGKDDPLLDDEAKSKLRAQAFGWLKAELAAWAKLIAGGDPKARAFVFRLLQHWRNDPDLAGVRDPDHLAKLPEAECREWLSLRDGVEALRVRAAGRAP